LEAGKAILREGERLILPKGTVIRREQVSGEADLEVGTLRLIPAKKDRWEYELRPFGRAHLRVKPERGALDEVEVTFAGKRGELMNDTTLGGGLPLAGATLRDPPTRSSTATARSCSRLRPSGSDDRAPAALRAGAPLPATSPDGRRGAPAGR
jgi:hypothetical protein